MNKAFRFRSIWSIDIVLGMECYTYPTPRDINIEECVSRCIDSYIPRPRGFIVSEVLKAGSLRNLIASSKMETIDRTHVIYAVEKIDIDTLSLVRWLSSLMKCSRYRVKGLKEAKAIAYQLVELMMCREPKPYIETPKFKAIALNLSDDELWHVGNEFSISIQLNKQCYEQCVKPLLKTLHRHRYVLNFYGYQRFGTRRPVTHLVGKALIARLWDEAVEIICGFPHPHESPDARKARLLFIEGRYKESAKLFRRLGLWIEYKLCRALSRGSSSLEALRALPRHVLMLYVNAFQAYLFNRILSTKWLQCLESRDYDECLNMFKNVNIAVPGYKCTDVDEDVYRLLRLEDVDIEMFRIDELKIAAEGSKRKVLVEVKDFDVQLNSMLRVEFVLDRGSFATTVLREFMRFTNPYNLS